MEEPPSDADPTDVAFSDLDPPSEGEPFVLRHPYEEDEIIAISAHIRSAIEEGMRVLEGGIDAFIEAYLKEKAGGDSASDSNKEGGETNVLDDETREGAIIKGSPRPYQLAFLEKCKQSNTIVHLGTGQGKTLIALLCIRHFFSSDSADEAAGAKIEGRRGGGKQTWFLVPSVALAVQHSVTLRANLPFFKVATACTTTSASATARDALARAQIVVATHGSALDLFRHYGDSFHLGRANLLIFDECHYATGNHGYVQFLETFYHRTPTSERPRIVGLTASPIINIRKSITRATLECLMSELETKLDSKIVCFSDLGEPTKQCLEAIDRNVEEQLVVYNNRQTSYSPLPEHQSIGLHDSRNKELNQLQNLYDELGPSLTGLYCADLARELSRSKYEGETPEQYEKMTSHLRYLSEFCRRQCGGRDNGQTKKLVALEKVLHKMLTSGEDKNGVGLVFVERRITALALHSYFRRRQIGYASTEDTIRCDCLVRQSHQVFKYLHRIHKMGYNECQHVTKEAEMDWLHQTRKIRTVLDKMRRKEINLLIATSVVEEGVDVSACSFVIVLDGIKTTKSYVQMKGRARQKNAKFFCFRDTSCKELTVPLEEAQRIDDGVRIFLEQRETDVATEDEISILSSYLRSGLASGAEEDAIQRGEYRTQYAHADLRSAKSLLNHYFLSIPMDHSARASKQTMKAQLPMFTDRSLILPAHLPPEIRKCELPKAYWFLRKKTKEEMLALMAVVRLHEHRLISDRLLPFKRNELHNILLEKVMQKLPKPPAFFADSGTFLTEECKEVHVYPLTQHGQVFDQHSNSLKGRGRQLGFISLSKMPGVLSMSFNHAELEVVHCEIGAGTSLRLSAHQWTQCSDFYSVLLNARWRRRTGRTYFSFHNGSSAKKIVPTYAIVSLTRDGKVDWTRMEKTVADYYRDESSRISAVRGAMPSNGERDPRLWAPRYSPNTTYISFAPSNLTCSSRFPNSDYTTYAQYYQKKHSFSVHPGCRLFSVKLLWSEPKKMNPVGLDYSGCNESSGLKRQKTDCGKVFAGRTAKEADCSVCPGLSPAHLPEDACMEAPLADASLYLHCVLLPQILYELDRRVLASAFLSHCSSHFTRLGSYLKRVKLESVIEVLTAKSCGLEDFSYDRFEYIGDAVLKLLHTDVLLRSPTLKQWTKCLHEGDLSKLRSAMGCNERLSRATVSAGVNRFILTMPLARGLWAPNGLVRKFRDQEEESPSDKFVTSEVIEPSTKVCADVMEALLGLVYVEFGFTAAADVAEELMISLPHVDRDEGNGPSSVNISADIQQQAENFVGEKFKNAALVKEAFTHPSFLFTDVPSYQKLEWIGDAVLCLAAREWAFFSYPSLPVADMVIIETTIVCNETLSCVAVRSGLHGLIQHTDASLPPRIEAFSLSLRQEEWGLWGSNPPKVLADVVEALIGAAHVDGGFKAGQRAALSAVHSVLHALRTKVRAGKKGRRLDVEEGSMMHPKQVLFELGNFFRVRVRAESSVARDSSSPIWRRKAWDQPSSHGDDAVCYVSCLGIELAVISEPANTTARNRGCALVSETFRRHPHLLQKLEAISLAVSDAGNK